MTRPIQPVVTDERLDRLVRQLLAERAEDVAAAALSSHAMAVRVAQQERDHRVPWRSASMTAYLRIAAVAAALAVAGAAAFYTPDAGPDLGTGAIPSTTPNASPTTQPTPLASTPPIDTGTWTQYVSDRYGFTIAYPAHWRAKPATRDWTLDVDADDSLSGGQEAFVGDNIRVGAWSVPIDRSTTLETAAGVEAWVEGFCERASRVPCEFPEGTVPLCVEVRDCHPGLLVAWPTQVSAFFTGGHYGDTMTVVTVWLDENAPATAPFGGSQRLLEAFLSTMDVWTESARQDRIDELNRQ